jgi:hypothetical protein
VTAQPVTQPWTPPCGEESELLPAGVWWDAVRVPSGVGSLALLWLAPVSGAVIADCERCWYWLVSPGTAASWAEPAGSEAIGEGSEILVPSVLPGADTSRVHWAFPPAPGRYLTDPGDLATAIRRAVQ